MMQPPGYVDPAHQNMVYRLNKGLYGLNQAGCLWHKIVREKIIELGFKQAHADPCVFMLENDGKIIAIIALYPLYIDDFIITGIFTHIISFKDKILNIFKGKDLATPLCFGVPGAVNSKTMPFVAQKFLKLMEVNSPPLSHLIIFMVCLYWVFM